MKKLILTLSLTCGVAAMALAQGTIIIDNSNAGNTALGSAATVNGAVFFQASSTSTPIPITTDFNVALLNSTSLGGTYTVLGSIIDQGVLGGGPNGGNGPGAGLFTDYSGSVFTAATSTTGYFEVAAWYSSDLSTYGDYASALAAANAHTAGIWFGMTPAFANPLGSGINLVPSLDNMPAFVLTTSVVPEPASFALAGLGAAALMIFRRRK